MHPPCQRPRAQPPWDRGRRPASGGQRLSRCGPAAVDHAGFAGFWASSAIHARPCWATRLKLGGAALSFLRSCCMARTFAIGDIHGDREALEVLLERLPTLTASDTLVFLGDYVDRGPDSAGVVRAVRALPSQTPARVVTLRGNHEDKWIECYDEPAAGFLLPRGNGCQEMYRSFVGKPPLKPDEELASEDILGLFDVRAWLPRDVVDWMSALPLWYEDEHAIYVHAGLFGEGTEWQHPSTSRAASLLWMREPDFFQNYQGKRLIFGHTVVTELPLKHLNALQRLFDDPRDVWVRGDLIGIDTGSGKGGFLSAVELPRMKIYESR